MNPTANQIKKDRQSAGLTQTQAAGLVGVALRTWQHWEFGDRAMPESAWRLFLILTSKSL